MAMQAVHASVKQGTVQAPLCAPPKEKRKENKKVGIVAGVVFCAAVLAGVYLVAYTPIHDWFHSMRMARLIAEYDQAVAALTAEERSAMYTAALAYNSRLQPGTHFMLKPEELDAYRAQLDVTGTGMMGYIRIPKLGVALPIYHTTDAEVLAQAVGHIPGSSLPVGGETCHTVLCGHRDLATAYLFHDLDKLEMGDTFTLTVLDETVTYAVDAVNIVYPRQIDDLAIEEGQDYCTLVTCHPHGSTTYRMLVRAKRVA